MDHQKALKNIMNEKHSCAIIYITGMLHTLLLHKFGNYHPDSDNNKDIQTKLINTVKKINKTLI